MSEIVSNIIIRFDGGLEVEDLGSNVFKVDNESFYSRWETDKEVIVSVEYDATNNMLVLDKRKLVIEVGAPPGGN